MATANPGGEQNGRRQQGAGAETERGAEARERRLERGYSVRQVTDYQASWTERERGQNGRFTVQLILDNGVEEYILETTADDLDVLLSLLKRSGHTMFDLDRKVLMFANLDAA